MIIRNNLLRQLPIMLIRFTGVQAILQTQHNFVFIEAIYVLIKIGEYTGQTDPYRIHIVSWEQ